MNILFYTPLNTRCRDIESQAAAFKAKGHRIFLLTQSDYGPLHENFRGYGYTVSAAPFISVFTSILVLGRMFHLIRFCYRNKIDVVYAHLEPCNFIAVLSQYVVRSRVIICRHHVDEARLYPFGKDLSYRLTYKLAKEIIVVSDHAKRYMVKEENVRENRITHINLAYDFSFYQRPDSDSVRSLREKFSTDILLLSVCRLTVYKRPELSIDVLKTLLQNGLNAKLVILGRGELHDSLMKKIEDDGLADNCILPGYVHNVLEYMAASDFLVHPSLLESSCISVKEAGLVKLPVIVCKGIGDNDEVIKHNVNGFLVNPESFVMEATQIIQENMHASNHLDTMGMNLQQTVFDLFDIRNIAPKYEELFHQS